MQIGIIFIWILCGIIGAGYMITSCKDANHFVDYDVNYMIKAMLYGISMTFGPFMLMLIVMDYIDPRTRDLAVYNIKHFKIW